MSGVPCPKPRFGAFEVRYQTGRGYGVFAPSGELLQVYRSHTAAEERCHREQIATDSKAKRGPRACMCCGRVFQSQGVHNRLCDSCRKTPDHLGEAVRPVIARKAG